jgi:imidazolonepropionase-like amidohydrolase
MMRGCFALMALGLASPLAAQSVAITGATLVIGDGSAPIDNGTLLINGGRVVAAGSDVAVPANAQRIDASGKWVTPGLIAGFSRVGLVEISAVENTDDASADKSPFSAALDVQYSIDPYASPIAVSRAAGITRAVVSGESARTMFGGYGAVIDLGDDRDPITRAKAFQYVEFGETGHNRAGGSRAAAHVLFRALMDDARRYARDPDDYESELLPAPDAKALLDVVNGTTRLLVHVEAATEIVQVLALKRDFPALKLVLVGASEGWRVADQIAAAKVPVIASALNDLPARFETLAATQSNVGRMHRAGVQVAIGMIDDNEAHQIRYVPQYAGNLVALSKVPRASGLSWAEAFAAISSTPAAIMGLDGELGSLRSGRRADVVIWTGDPLELSSQAEQVMIDGVPQSLTNRQDRLRERYRNPAPGDLPKAYDR